MPTSTINFTDLESGTYAHARGKVKKKKTTASRADTHTRTQAQAKVLLTLFRSRCSSCMREAMGLPLAVSAFTRSSRSCQFIPFARALRTTISACRQRTQAQTHTRNKNSTSGVQDKTRGRTHKYIHTRPHEQKPSELSQQRPTRGHHQSEKGLQCVFFYATNLHPKQDRARESIDIDNNDNSKNTMKKINKRTRPFPRRRPRPPRAARA